MSVNVIRSEFMDWKSNLFWCIMGIIGGAISSFLISLYFYLKSFINKKILYSSMYLETVLSNSYYLGDYFSPFDVDIINKYDYLALFEIRINGKSSIEANSFINKAPFRIHFNHESKIVTNNINIKIVPSNPENIISYTINNNDILINFECLGKGETILIYILYSDGEPELKGYLIDGKISHVGESFFLYFISMAMKIIFSAFLLFGIMFLTFCFIYYKTNLCNTIDIPFFKSLHLDELFVCL